MVPSFRFDLRFVEIGAELNALGDALEALETQLVYLRDQRRTQRFADLTKSGAIDDDAERSLAFQELDIEDHAYQKTFRGGFVVSLWAVYESAIVEVARFLQKRMNLELSPTDLRGDNVLSRTRKYFDHVLHFPLHSAGTDWSFLQDIYAVRNGFAHAYGRLNAMNDRTRAALTRVIEAGLGIEDEWGDVLVKEQFTRRAFTTMRDLVRDLVDRSRVWDDDRRASEGGAVTTSKTD